jgi:hypothetical protein
MRRLLAIALLSCFCLPLLTPLLEMTASAEVQSHLPACCRRNGAHHCGMTPEQAEALLHGQHFTNIHSQCPLFPHALASFDHHDLALHSAQAIFAALVSHPTARRQIEAWARVAEAGARHKRGPPSVRLS